MTTTLYAPLTLPVLSVWAGSIDTRGAGTITLTQAGVVGPSATYSGSASLGGSIVIAASGALTLSATNAGSALSIRSGTVRGSLIQSVGTSTRLSNVTVSSGFSFSGASGTVFLSDGVALSGAVTFSSGLTICKRGGDSDRVSFCLLLLLIALCVCMQMALGWGRDLLSALRALCFRIWRGTARCKSVAAPCRSEPRSLALHPSLICLALVRLAWVQRVWREARLSVPLVRTS